MKGMHIFIFYYILNDKLSLEWLYKFAFPPAVYESNRFYIPEAYSLIIEISYSSWAFPALLLLGLPADPSFLIPRKFLGCRWRLQGLFSEHYSWHVRWITFPARPPPSYGLYLPELWRVLGPALINCLGFQFPKKWDS